MQLSHIAHVRMHYYASGMILYAMAIEHVQLCVEFQDRLQTLIDRAHEQDGNFHDSWRQNGDALTRQRFKEVFRRAPTQTLSFTVAKSPQAKADQQDRELVPSPSHHSPL